MAVPLLFPLSQALSRAFSLALPLGLSLALAPAALAEDAPEDPRAADRPALERTEATSRLGTFKKDWRSAAREPARKVTLLKELVEGGRHPDLSKELKKALKDKDRNVRLCAIQMLGTQRDDQAVKALAGVAKPGKRINPYEVAEAIRSLGYTGYDAKSFGNFEKLFYQYKSRDIRQAVVEAVGRQKDPRAFSLLVSVLDQPNPKDPHAADAQPPSYWKSKYDEWITYKDDVIAALEGLSGRKFYNSDVALDWAREHGAEKGISIEKTPDPWL